jgi:hypothetical protein
MNAIHAHAQTEKYYTKVGQTIFVDSSPGISQISKFGMVVTNKAPSWVAVQSFSLGDARQALIICTRFSN